MCYPSHGKRLLAGNLRASRRGEVRHLVDPAMARALAGAQNVDWFFLEIRSPLSRREHVRPACIGDQATVEHMKRPGDERRLEHVLDCEQPTLVGFRVKPCPSACG